MNLDELEKKIKALPAEERFATLVCCNALVFGCNKERIVLDKGTGIELLSVLEQDNRFICEDFNMQTMISLNDQSNRGGLNL